MAGDDRLEHIVSLVDERGFVSVKELSELFEVSEVTIRRDLHRLADDGRLRRTFGGGVSLRTATPSAEPVEILPAASLAEGSLIDRVDVLVATSLDPQSDRALVDRAARHAVPIVGESLGAPGMEPVVSVDNFQAGRALGVWAGHYVREHLNQPAHVLDLTYRLSNTQARSQGFVAGIREVLPDAQVILSINVQSRFQTAYQLTVDALSVHPNINVIFAINDATAWGAILACRDLGVNPESIVLVTFGLEGDTLKDALVSKSYCKAGLAMFPEIVAPVCIEAAIKVYDKKPVTKQLTTPYAILTGETLSEFYTRTETGWSIHWETVKKRLTVPLDITGGKRQGSGLPKRIGFVVPFSEHEWYKSLTVFMQEYANSLGIEFEVVDVVQTLRDDVILRQRAIAQRAAEQIQRGDVLMIDGSDITFYLAEELAKREGITVITNSVPVFELLQDCQGVTLLSTGGSLRRASEILIGPTAEAALRDLRADKLFLAVTGISFAFGLSHTNVGEVAVKQAMLRSAREVILLADHTRFGQESVIQIAPLSAVNKVITDNALPASTRLELSKLGIEVIIAKT